MTVQMFAETGAPFDLLSTFSGKFRRCGRSTLNIDVIAEPVRRLFPAWEQFATPTQAREPRHNYIPIAGQVEGADFVPLVMTLTADIPVKEVRPFPVTPVEAVEYLVGLLQISRDAVLRGTQVSESSFYRWKRSPQAEPRPESLGRLWPTVRGLSQVESVHPNLVSWYHSTPEAQEAFEAGRLNRLIQLEFEWLNANAQEMGLRSVTSAALAAPWFGDVADLEDTAEDDAADAVELGSQAPGLRSQSSRLTRSKRLGRA